MLEAASGIIHLGVFAHILYDHKNQGQRDVRLHFQGLGSFTHNYLGMLLRHSDTKPHKWIVHAVQRVAEAERLGVVVDSEIARAVVLEVHRRTKLGKTVTPMDYAIWLTERDWA